jgi:DnaJ-class molecular chaperone
MDSMNLYYDILGLNQGASLEEVEQAYKDLLGLYTNYDISHDPEFRLNAFKKIREIEIAYDELKPHLMKHSINNFEVKDSAIRDRSTKKLYNISPARA